MNQLYIELKEETAAASLVGMPAESDIRSQMLFMWTHQLQWATSSPEKRKALAHLLVSDDITPESHQKGNNAFVGVRKLMDRSRQNGPMRDAPLDLVIALMTGVADATVDLMIHDPAHAEQNCMTAFEALWRMVS